MIRKKKITVIILLIIFLVVTSFTTFLFLSDSKFDIRSRATYDWESCIYSIADLDGDENVSLSDFSIWLVDFKNYRLNSSKYSSRSDLNDTGTINLSDFALWLQLWRQDKACKQGLDEGDSSNCADNCFSENTNPVVTPNDYTSTEFDLDGQKVGFYYPTDSMGEPDSNKAPFPVVVFHHGMAAKYDYYTWLAEDLAQRGYIVLMPNRPMFEMDMEAATTVTTQLLTYLENRNSSESDIFYQMVDFDNVILSGHSLGSGLSLFASETLGSRIKALILLSSGGQVSFGDNEALELPGMDMFENLIPQMNESFDRMRSIAQETNTPIMYIIGSNDKMISPEGTKELYGLTNSPKVIAIIEGGNHVQFVEGGAMETQIMNLLDGEATISAETQRSIALKYINAWLDYLVKDDGNGKAILEAGVNEVPNSLNYYDYMLP